MTMEDSDFMLELKNYPETRQFAIATHDKIKKADHYAYLEKNIQHFQIIEDNAGERLGAFRLQDNEVSIWVDRNHWSIGIATYVLQHECDKGMTAKIVMYNIGSMRAFIRAGFLPKYLIGDYYIFQK
jgi:hypothetical protein